MLKKLILTAAAVAAFIILAGCSKKEPDVSFLDLKLGASKAEVVAQLGEKYEEVGTQPKRLVYTGKKLFDFVGNKTETRTDVYLNLSDQAYSYCYYVYDTSAATSDAFEKFFEEKFGPGTESAAGGLDFKNGDLTYTLLTTDTFLAVNVY